MQDNILSAVRWLVSDCQSLDSLVFAFSGHGSLDTWSDEQCRDGILPCDFQEVTILSTCSCLLLQKCFLHQISKHLIFTHILIISCFASQF